MHRSYFKNYMYFVHPMLKYGGRKEFDGRIMFFFIFIF